jgi:hypothetical protein
MPFRVKTALFERKPKKTKDSDYWFSLLNAPRNPFGPRTHGGPQAMGPPINFLKQPIHSWSEIPDFQTFSNFVRHVPVVKDECEKLCKRTSDYASKNGMTEADFSATLQLVGSAIKVLPSQMLKRDIVKAYDNV